MDYKFVPKMPSPEGNEQFESGCVYKLRFLEEGDSKRVRFSAGENDVHFEVWDTGEGKGKFRIFNDVDEVIVKSSKEAPSVQEAFLQLKQKALELGIVPEIPGSSKWEKKDQQTSGGGVEVRG